VSLSLVQGLSAQVHVLLRHRKRRLSRASSKGLWFSRRRSQGRSGPHTADYYGYPREFRATGVVLAIRKLYGEQTLWPGSDIGGNAVAGSGRFFSDSHAIRWEEEKEGLAFIGYIVDLEVS
jgi:hypothetical protein